MLHLDDAVCVRNEEEEEILHFDDAAGIRWAIGVRVVLCCGRLSDRDACRREMEDDGPHF